MMGQQQTATIPNRCVSFDCWGLGCFHMQTINKPWSRKAGSADDRGLVKQR